MPVITPLPALDRTSATFKADVDTFFATELPAFSVEANAAALAMNLNSTSDTSASSVLIGTDEKTFTVSADKSFLGGMYLVIADTAAPSTNSMYGQVTSYSGTTLVMNILSVRGSGTKTAWTISQSSAGVVGAIGKNIVINGSCQVSQVNRSSVVVSATGTYPIDNVLYSASVASKLSHQQISTSAYALDSSNALLTSVQASYTPAAGDFFINQWRCEGLNTAHLKWGTANAKAVSLQFEATVSVAGTYSGSIINAANNLSYPFSFVLAASTTTLVKIENIAGYTAGTWPSTAALSLSVTFDVGCGSNYKTTGGAWASGAYWGVTGATALVAQTGSSTLAIANVQLNEGSVCKLFERKLYPQVFAECYRYLPSITSETTASFVGAAMKYSTTDAQVAVPFMYPARTDVTGIVASSGGILSVRDTSFNYQAATAINFSRGSKTACELNLTGLSGVAGGNGSMCIFNSATGTIFFTGAQI